MNEQSAAETEGRLSCHAVERTIRDIWSGYFGTAVFPYDDFFDLGGDSLAMIDVVVGARERGLAVRSSVAMRNPTPARLAEALTVGSAEPVRLPALCANIARSTSDTRSVPIGRAETAEPLYVVHSDGHVEIEREAVAAWGGARAARGFSLRGLRGLIPPAGTVGELAGELRQALQTEQAAGPYRLAGFGPGAVLAFEMARQLTDAGEPVALLALVRPPVVAEPGPGRDQLLRQRLAMLAGRFGLTDDQSVQQIHARVRADGWYDDGVTPADLPWLQTAWVDLTLAVRAYEPAGYVGRTLLFTDAMDSPAAEEAWRHATGDPEIHRLDYGLESPIALVRDAQVADVMRKALDT